MRKIKPTTKYQTVSFPEPFYNEIKEFVIKQEKYRSIAEFVKEAVREKMNRDLEDTVKSIGLFGIPKTKPKLFGATSNEDKLQLQKEIQALRLISKDSKTKDSQDHEFVTKEYLDKSLEELSKKMLQELGFSKKGKKETNGNGHGLV